MAFFRGCTALQGPLIVRSVVVILRGRHGAHSCRVPDDDPYPLSRHGALWLPAVVVVGMQFGDGQQDWFTEQASAVGARARCGDAHLAM